MRVPSAGGTLQVAYPGGVVEEVSSGHERHDLKICIYQFPVSIFGDECDINDGSSAHADIAGFDPTLMLLCSSET